MTDEQKPTRQVPNIEFVENRRPVMTKIQFEPVRSDLSCVIFMWRECHVHRTFMERLPGHMTNMTSTFDKFDRSRHKKSNTLYLQYDWFDSQLKCSSSFGRFVLDLQLQELLHNLKPPVELIKKLELKKFGL